MLLNHSKWLLGILTLFIFSSAHAFEQNANCDPQNKSSENTLPNTQEILNYSHDAVPASQKLGFLNKSFFPKADLLAHGKLTPFWAQEYIGADLVLEEMQSIKNLRKVRYGNFEAVHLESMPKENIDPLLYLEIKKNQSETWAKYLPIREALKKIPGADNIADDHGTLAMNLTFGKETGVTRQINLLVTNASENVANSDKSDLLRKILDRKVELFSASLMLPVLKPLEEFQKKGGLVVLASGNDFPADKKQTSAEKFIIAGSFSPLGLVSCFTSTYPEVDIVAPSDLMVTSSFNNQLAPFGGTSGAQPLVTGAIANVMALLPKISQLEIENILKMTAVPVDGSETNQIGSGMVNAYKMFRIALKLKQGWPSNRNKISLTSAEWNNLTDFNSEVETLLKAASSIQDDDDVSQAQKLKLLRKAFYLDPKNKILIAAIERFYRDAGLDINADFFRSLLGVDEPFLLEAMKYEESEIRLASIRALTRLGKSATPFLNQSLRSPDYRELIISAVSADQIGEKELVHQSLLNYFSRKAETLGPLCEYGKPNYTECVNRRFLIEEELLSLLYFMTDVLNYNATDFKPYCSGFSTHKRQECEIHASKPKGKI